MLKAMQAPVATRHSIAGAILGILREMNGLNTSESEVFP